MVCPEKWQAHERCDFPSRLARPDCHRRSREYADERDCHARRDRRTRRRQSATHHRHRLERASELGKRSPRSLLSVFSVVSVLLFVFSVLNLWLCFPPAAKDFHHREHKVQREKQNRELGRICLEDLPPVTRYLLPLPSRFRRLARAASRVLRRSPASRKRRRSSCVLRITGGTGLGLPISSRATNVRKAVVVCFRSPLL